MEAFSGGVDSSMFKLWSPGVGLDHNEGSTFYIGRFKEKKISSNQKPIGQKSYNSCGSIPS